MFKYIILALSLFSTGSARLIGSDPNTWSPNKTEPVLLIDKCESCKMFVGKVNSFMSDYEKEIISYTCTDQMCEILYVNAIKKVLKDPESICTELDFCKDGYSSLSYL